MKRQIIHIDQDLCNGCGQCITACAEGAIALVDGKAKLISDVYCDGLGACLDECPTGALTIAAREAEAFDEEAVNEHLHEGEEEETLACGCPGSSVRALGTGEPCDCSHDNETPAESQLQNWPVQWRLLPPKASFFKDAHLLLAADCCGFASPDFHSRYLQGKTLMVGCPKLDNAPALGEKLTAVLQSNNIRQLSVMVMEVPCCNGLSRIARQALALSGKDMPLTIIVVSAEGKEISRIAL